MGNWDGYDANCREYFRKIRDDQRLFDVTLVTDDGQHIHAHKIILSAGSNFFSDIFMKSNHSNMLVYLKGISSDKLEPVIDFIYKGEAFIPREQLKVFIEIREELKIKGLEGELTGDGENYKENPANFEESQYGSGSKNFETGNSGLSEGTDTKIDATDAKIDDTDAKIDEEILRTNVDLRLQINEIIEKEEGEDTEVKINEGLLRTDLDPRLQLNEIIEKDEGVWRCKKCGKTATTKQNMEQHAERHVEGMVYACNLCSKTFSNSSCLRMHNSRLHSDFSCHLCGKTGMSRGLYKNHKKNHGD